MDFVHLHVHSEYSMLDGACRISEMAKAAADMGQKALAITDHGNMFGAVAFYKACKSAGIKPIIGCEVYVAPHGRNEHDKDEKYHHLILLCENEAGYRNLCKLVSLGFTDGFYAKPRIDDELLSEYSEGLIALSACVAGRIPQLLLSGAVEEAESAALRYEKLFGKGNFYIELQNHGSQEEETVLPMLIALAKNTGIPTAATNDAHYIYKRDADTQAILACIQTKEQIANGRPFGFESDEFYLKSASEMEALFADVPEAIENTVNIADRCSFDFDFTKRHLPTYPVKDGKTAKQFLTELAESGLKRKFENNELCLDGHTYEDYRFRMIYELLMVAKMGYCDYYLIVWDFVNKAKEMGIPVGPGRGSGAGSLVAWLIGITEIDSIKYDLLFERFLNPERVSMPDFDIDFCYDRRNEVIDYVAEKYGRDHVSQIAAFGTLKASAAVRDVGRVLGIAPSEVDAVARLIPHRPDMTLREALKGKELSEMYRERETVRQLIDTSLAVEGFPRNVTTHAAGVVITERPVSDYLPLTTSSGAVLTQYDMNTVAELGLLKFDFLALRYLTVIENACMMVRRTEPEFRIDKIDLCDGETFDLVCEGETDGMFQLESPGMKRLIVNMRPRSVEDLMIAIALYRPGPMDSIPALLHARNSGKKPEYKIEKLREILDGTSGCIVYQEQVMQIFRTVAGYSFGRADVVRRAMAKKHADELEKERDSFISGAKNNLVSFEDANELFDSMASFASYAFNKSHAAAYAVVAYRTAYLKAHYPKEYMAALLSSVCGDVKKTAEYISYLEKKNCPLLPPHVNESELRFAAAPSGVRFGLLGIRNIGEGFISALCEERKRNGPYRSLVDFVERMNDKGANKSQIAALVGCGAFDGLGIARSAMADGLDGLMQHISDLKRRQADGQIDLFSMLGEKDTAREFTFPETAEYSLGEKLALEKELTGMWFSGHPLGEYAMNIAAMEPDRICNILSSFDEMDTGPYRDGDSVAVCCMISSVSVKTSKAGNRFAVIKAEDEAGDIECLIFEKILDRVGDFLSTGRAVYIKGKVTAREEEAPKITVFDLMPLIPDTEFVKLADSGVLIKPKNGTKPGYESRRAAPEEKASGEVNTAPTPAQSSAAKPEDRQDPKPAGQPQKPKRLYIKLTLDEQKDIRLHALVEIFDGEIPCIFYDPSTARYNDSGLKVRVSDYLLSVMRTIAGDDHIVLK